MREIKFRAWDKARKEYWGPYDFLNDETLPRPIRNMVVEQYTGLEDVNGKEIYEGDIVKISNLKPIFEVKYSIPFAEFLMEAYGELYEEFQCWNGKEVIEVIGNIHENPELLEEEE